MTDTLAPADESDIAGEIRAAAASREPLLICGNASKAGYLRPVQAARTLSLRAHTGITLYSPKEMVIAARAGTTLAEIEQTLAAENQHIVSEPPDFSALFGTDKRQTLGGAVAANLSGPRRIAWGALRDQVIGMRAVNGSGEIIRSGGRVLKNVTGLDICKLLTGSFGTLAAMTEITLRLLPAPESVGTLVLPGLDAVEGVRKLTAALGSPFGVSGAAWLPAGAPVPGLPAGPAALIRIEEFSESVSYRLGRLRDQLGGDILDDPATRKLWAAIRDASPLAAAPGEAVWRISVRPSAGPGVLAALAPHDARGFLDWGGGLVWIAGAASSEMHRQVAAAAQAARGTWTLMRAPEPLRAGVDVIPPEAPALAAITRRVKAAFDPAGILNPGRMYAGL